jgi:Flp pilus assembly protein TadD/4-amino-4-deoxy-L-arabinose transferase-like glycosyltransferase
MPMSEPDAEARACRTPESASELTWTPESWAARRFLLILTLICLIGLLCRLAILAEYVGSNPLARAPVNDAFTYWSWAGRIAAGQEGAGLPFFSAPLYPYLLGLLRSLGGSLTAVYVLQIVADVLAAALLALAARMRFGAGVGLLAAALLLLLQDPASLSLRILPGSLQLLLVVLTWSALAKLERNLSISWTILAGVAMGLLCLAYAPALLLVALVVLWLVWRSGWRWSGFGRAGIVLLTVGVVISPATIHNWLACSELILIRSGGGITLRHGNQPISNGTFTPISGVSDNRDRMHLDAARLYQAETGEKPTWKQVDRFFRNGVLADWRADPLWALKLGGIKLYRFLSSRNYGDIYQHTSEMAAGFNRRLWLTPLPVAWLMGPALAGLIVMMRRPIRHAPEWMPFLVPLLVAVVFWYSQRYRIPVVPIIVVTASWAICQGLQVRRKKAWTVAVVLALALSIATGPVNRALGFDRLDRSNAYFNVALALTQQGKLAEAAEYQREGLEHSPKNANMRIGLGDLLNRLGRYDEALAQFNEARSLKPADPSLWEEYDVRLLGRIAGTLLQQKKPKEAEAALNAALRTEPANPVLLRMLAGAKEMQGHHKDACAVYEQALQYAPNDLEILNAYGGLLYQLQNWTKAREILEKTVRLRPRDFEAHYHLGVVGTRLKDFGFARRSFERALELRPRSVKTLHDLGWVNYLEGRYDDAVDCFRRALSIDPASQACKSALEQVEPLARQSGVKAP